jgi:hypothetical protein
VGGLCGDSSSSSAAEVDDQLEAERFGDTMKRVEVRCHPARFEPRDGRLPAANASSKLDLCHAQALACLADPFGNLEYFLGTPVTCASCDRSLTRA